MFFFIMMVILNVINEPKVRFYSDACNVRKFFYTLRGLKLCISTSPVPAFADNFEKIEPRTPCSFLPRTFCNLKEVRPRTFCNLKEVRPRTFGNLKELRPCTLCNLEEVELCLTAGGSRREHLRIISSPSPSSTSKGSNHVYSAKKNRSSISIPFLRTSLSNSSRKSNRL